MIDPSGKVGKLINAAIKVVKNGGNLKKAGKEFIADVVESGAELLDGDLTVADAEAVFNLVSPVSTKELKSVKRAITGKEVIGRIGKLKKSVKSFRRLAKDHRKRAREFRENPTVKKEMQGGRATPEQIKAQQEKRAAKLERDAADFDKQADEAEKEIERLSKG